MAHACDERNVIPLKQQTFDRVNSAASRSASIDRDVVSSRPTHESDAFARVVFRRSDPSLYNNADSARSVRSHYPLVTLDDSQGNVQHRTKPTNADGNDRA
jgi:hypothetical protein